MRPSDTSMGGVRRDFPSTSWSALLQLGDADHAEYRQRLASLVERYWKPVYCYIRAAWCRQVEDAKDLTQEFFTRLLERQDWAVVSREKGSFRAYIKGALRHFMANAHDAERARRPHDGLPLLHLEQAEAEWAHLEPKAREGTPEEVFDRTWIRHVLEEGVRLLREALLQRGKEIYFQVFHLYHYGTLEPAALGPPSQEDLSYEEVAVRLGLQPSDVRNHLAYARSELRAILRDLASSYSENERAAEEEFRFLTS